MSRESAYRLRNRREGALFAALWDRAIACGLQSGEIHTGPLANDRLMAVLGTHYRRKRGDYSNIGSLRPLPAEPDPT